MAASKLDYEKKHWKHLNEMKGTNYPRSWFLPICGDLLQKSTHTLFLWRWRRVTLEQMAACTRTLRTPVQHTLLWLCSRIARIPFAFLINANSARFIHAQSSYIIYGVYYYFCVENLFIFFLVKINNVASRGKNARTIFHIPLSRRLAFQAIRIRV